MQTSSLLQHSAPPPEEVCSACRRVIGSLEQPYLWNEQIVCFGCHRDLSQGAATNQATLAERVFLNDESVSVTRTVAIVGGSAYGIADVRFVRLSKTTPRRVIPVGAALVGIATAVFGLNRHLDLLDVALLVAGGLLFSLGLTTVLVRRPRYSVLITAHGVEACALQTTKAQYARRIVDAIGEAVVERGQYVAENPPGELGLSQDLRGGLAGNSPGLSDARPSEAPQLISPRS